MSPPTGGSECAFAGKSSLCGACIAERCQLDIDACCEDSFSCAGTLTALDECATNRSAACTSLQAKSTGDTPRGKLATCVRSACRECQPFSGKSQTRCAEPPLGTGTSCKRQLAEPPDSPANDFISQ